MTPYMADEIPEHELNEWLKTLFFALERMCLMPGPTINLLTSERYVSTSPPYIDLTDTELSLRECLIKGMLKNRKGK